MGEGATSVADVKVKPMTTKLDELKIEHVPIGDLHPDPFNPRRISDAELESLTRSIRQFGLIDPIIARQEDKIIIGGHQRLVAARRLGLKTEPHDAGAWERFWVNTVEHLFLVAVSLAMAIGVSIPLWVIAARFARVGQVILGVVGVIQTIPALALLVFMIPLLDIGAAPAIAALFLYSLLPIVRNTYAGLHDIPGPIVESAIALGLSPRQRLRLVELPLAARSILAGIKTSAVINIGTATLGALIGTGGYGQPILTGIRLDDVGLIMQGAVPAAGLAVLCQTAFELAESRLVSKGLRIKAS